MSLFYTNDVLMDCSIIYYNESSEFDSLSFAQSYVIAIDSHLVSTHYIEMPNISFSKANKAIPFLLEDVLLDEIDGLDFFIQKTPDRKHYEVAVINKNIIKNLKKKIQMAKLNVQNCVFDFMLLPSQSSVVNYTNDGDYVLFRYGNFLGGKINQTTFDELFLDTQKHSSTPNISHIQNINILNSDWSSNWKQILYKWRIAAGALLLLMALAPVQLMLDRHNLTNQISTWSNTNEVYFKKLFPEVGRIVDLHSQIKQKLSTLNIKKPQLDTDLLAKINSDIKTKTTIKRLQFSNQTLKIQQ